MVTQTPASPPVDDDIDHGGDDRDGGEPIRWVTIATFTEPTTAHIARLRLESEDIPAIVADENMGTALWHYALATGGIKLQVPADQAAAAATALQTTSPLPDSADDEEECCPACRSTNLGQPSGLRRGIALFFLALLAATFHPLIGVIALCVGICFLLTIRRRRCNACGAWYRPSPRGFDVIAKDGSP
jgi:hypothetical protein